MWDGTVIKLTRWSQFATRLSEELNAIGHTGCVTVRNFNLVTYPMTEDGIPDQGSPTTRMDIVKATGTDRDKFSCMWNVEGFDYQHAASSSQKTPDQIIYAFTIDVSKKPYLVYHDIGVPETFCVTKNLGKDDGMLVYDRSKLQRASKNEYWFNTKPLEALMFVFRSRR